MSTIRKYLCTRNFLQTITIMNLYRIINKVISLAEVLTYQKVRPKWVLKEHIFVYSCAFAI